MFKHAKILQYIFNALLFLYMMQQQLWAAPTKDNSIGKTTQKNNNFFIQWGNLSGDTTDLSTFLYYDSLVLQLDHASCEQAAIVSFRLIVLYEDTAALSFELTSNKITEEIKHNINKLSNVNRIIIEDVRLFCLVNGKESIRPAKFNATYTIVQD